MSSLLLSGTGLSNFACSAEECLCWIIILLNILTIFYLVFCAWFKVTKAVRVIGYVWASALAVGSVAVVALHTCIFTILSTVFTGLVIMAVLSVAFNKGVFANESEEEKPVKASGSYVIHETDGHHYVFVLYDTKKKAIAKSCFKYISISETKEAIELCRKNGFIAAVEDRTKNWIEFVNHPKFELVNIDGKFSFTMSLINETVIIKSETFDDYEQCKKTMESAILAVRSEKLFFAEREVLSDEQFEYRKFEIKVQENTEKIAEPVVKAVQEIATSMDVAAADNGKAVETGEITLKDGLAIAAKTARKEKITKKYVADYLKAKFGAEIETNCRANYIKSGKLPLADTHYVLNGKNKTCFAFIYEVNNTVMMLLKVSDSMGKKFAKGHKTVHTSSFPKSKNKWYSIIVDDTFTNEDVEAILEESVLQMKGKLAK
ncbi:MAG: hypothetical protein IJR66_01675 [Clostridia bacterium]|nr:hypothetical protein [Clostridia bacterium]